MGISVNEETGGNYCCNCCNIKVGKRAFHECLTVVHITGFAIINPQCVSTKFIVATLFVCLSLSLCVSPFNFEEGIILRVEIYSSTI